MARPKLTRSGRELPQRDWAAFENMWADAHSAPGGEVVKTKRKLDGETLTRTQTSINGPLLQGRLCSFPTYGQAACSEGTSRALGRFSSVFARLEPGPHIHNIAGDANGFRKRYTVFPCAQVHRETPLVNKCLQWGLGTPTGFEPAAFREGVFDVQRGTSCVCNAFSNCI